MKDLNIVFAGFGGQGILFAGKVVAYAGLIEGRELSWLPSYGPEMRGGTANCSICLSDNVWVSSSEFLIETCTAGTSSPYSDTASTSLSSLSELIDFNFPASSSKLLWSSGNEASAL